MRDHINDQGIVCHGGIRVSTLTERATKFRLKAALPASSKRGGSGALDTRLLALLPPGAKDTRALGRDRSSTEIKVLSAPGKGSCPNKARKSKRESNTSPTMPSEKSSGDDNTDSTQKNEVEDPLRELFEKTNPPERNSAASDGDFAYLQAQSRDNASVPAYQKLGEHTIQREKPYKSVRQQDQCTRLVDTTNLASAQILHPAYTTLSGYAPDALVKGHKRPFGHTMPYPEQMLDAPTTNCQRLREPSVSSEKPYTETLKQARPLKMAIPNLHRTSQQMGLSGDRSSNAVQTEESERRKRNLSELSIDFEASPGRFSPKRQKLNLESEMSKESSRYKYKKLRNF